MVVRRLERSLKHAFRLSPRLKSLSYRMLGFCHEVRLKGTGLRSGFAGGVRAGGVNPKNMIWIFCTIRSGSTWLRSMMEELMVSEVWEEPGIGQLFGEFYDSSRAQESNLRRPDFVMGNPTRKTWVRSIRNFVLDTARAAHPAITPEHYLIVKEPNGAIGAPPLMEALPESRMVLLVRDPRDVAASELDARKKGSWGYYKWHKQGAKGRSVRADKKPNDFVKKRAHNYLRNIANAKKAYEAHRGRKVLIRYEDLRADTLGTMRRLCSVLGISADEEKLARVVEKHSWENVSEQEKGSGKFYRKATPGGWREDLTPSQTRTIERITAPLLEEFYP